MKRYLGIVVAVAFVLFAIVFASQKWSAKVVEAERDANMARVKTEYLERVGWIRSNPDEKSYKDEVSTFLRWYFEPFAAGRDPEELERIVARTARKMSAEARARALAEFALPEPFAAAFRA